MLGHELRLVEQLFAGLAEVDAELNVVPHAARSWEVLEDGRCFHIYLRDDVRWTHGSPVTADDYAYAWLRILDPRLAENEYVGHLLEDVAGARAYRLGQLNDPAQVGIRALDDQTLEVCLEQPLPYFPYLLAHSTTFPVPRQVVERWGDAWWQPEHMVSNGPFRLAYLEREHVVPPPPPLYSHVVLEHNPLYFGGGSGNLARVEYVAIRDEAERLARFRSGELDQARCWEVPEELAAFCQDSQELSTRWWILLPRPPLDDVRVRRAIAMAVDWGGLAGRRSTSPAMGGLVPPGMPGHTPGLALPHDLAQARRLLAEAGYPEGRGLPPLRIQCVMRDVGAAAAQLLAEALHVDVDFHRVSPATVLEDASGSQLIFQGWQADLPDPDNFLRQSDTLHILHLAGWQNPELEALLDRAAHMTDRAVRMALYRQADRRLVVEQALVVPIAYAGSGDLSQPWVHGARPNRMGHLRLKDVVVEKLAGG